MKNNLFKYSGISTKIKAMESRLITKESLVNLASMQTTSDFVSFLKKHPSYRPLFSHFDERELHRGKIEAILINSSYTDYAKIYRFSNTEQRSFLNIYFIRFEIDIIKACLRNLFDNEPSPYDLSVFKSFFQTHSELQLELLIQSKTLTEFITSLNNTEYFHLLDDVSKSHDDIFHLENALDVYYYKRYWQFTNKYLNKNEQQIIQNIIGKEIDLINLTWIYRMKKYFNSDSTNIYSFIIPISYKLKKSELTKLIEAPTINEFLDLFSKTYYKSYSDLFNKDMTVALHNIMSKIYKSTVTRSPLSIACIVSYLFYKDEEIDKLTTTLECIRYQLSATETLEYLQTGGV